MKRFKRFLALTGMAFAGVSTAVEAPVGLDKIPPNREQLGVSWSSSRVVVLVDPLSSPSVVTNADEGPNWLKTAQSVVGKNGCEAYAVLRYYHGSNSVIVWINRFATKGNIRRDWGTEKGTRLKLDNLPNIGDEVRFYQRQGMHNNIAFCRDSYLFDVEGIDTPIDKLIQLAEALDSNLLKAVELSAARRRRTGVTK